MSELFKADNEYKEWIAGISTDFRRSQIRASMKINDEMLRFYWKLGKGISSMSEQFGYGTRFYKTVSDLHAGTNWKIPLIRHIRSYC